MDEWLMVKTSIFGDIRAVMESWFEEKVCVILTKALYLNCSGERSLDDFRHDSARWLFRIDSVKKCSPLRFKSKTSFYWLRFFVVVVQVLLVVSIFCLNFTFFLFYNRSYCWRKTRFSTLVFSQYCYFI